MGRSAIVAALTLAALALSPLASAPVLAGQDIVLRLSGSEFEIGGELRSYDGRRYVVAAPGFGELSLEVGRYACVSGACAGTGAERMAAADSRPVTLEMTPLTGSAPAHIVLDGAPALEADLLPALVRGYARHLDGTARQLVGVDAGTTRFQIADARGRDLADVEINRREPAAVVAALASGTATLGAVTRVPTPAELAGLPGDARDAIGAHESVLGLDGVAVVVAPGNPATRLPAAMVARILSGEAHDWSEAGLPAGPIRVYAVGERAPEALAGLLGRRELPLARSATRLPDEAALSDAVARDPGGIGISSLAQLRSARSLDVVLGCGITARANDFSVKTEDYPLVRRLYLYSKGQPADPLAQEFVRFAVSPEAQTWVREGGIVDQSIIFADDADERRRLADAQTWTRGGPVAQALNRQLTADVAQARHLSLALRFKLSSADLDAKARGDIQRLAQLLGNPEMRGRTVMLAGFTDASGPPDVNAYLSQKRAEEVRQALLDALATAGVTGAAAPAIEARGYGPAAPVACNGGEPGQHRNRRVEVWLRDAGAPALPAATSPTAAAPSPPPIGRKAGRTTRARAAQVGQKSKVR